MSRQNNLIPEKIMAGIGHPTLVTDDDVDPQVFEVLKRIFALFALMIKAAEGTAAIYCDHAERGTPCMEDYLRALKFQARNFIHTVQSEELEDTVKMMFQDDSDEEGEIEEGSEEEGSDEEDSDEEEEDSEAGIKELLEYEAQAGPFSASTCSCDVCTSVNQAQQTWEAWCPEDVALAHLKKFVDETENRVRPLVNSVRSLVVNSRT